jgi:pectate lyase
MKRPNIYTSILHLSILYLIVIGSKVWAQDACQPVGWATQNGGISGGGSASPTVVSDYDALKNALTSETVKVVHVSGKILIPDGGRITIQDQTGKTIFGLSGSRIVSSDMSKDGSGIVYIKRCKNFMIRNIVFEGPGAYDTDGYDNFCIDDCQNFWIDHCEFHDGMDGNLDIKNMSDFISVTWSTFSYEKPPKAGGSGGADDHRYSSLIGSSDGATEDESHLNVTFYNCWWGEGCRERMPRMRYGKLHVVNSLFSSSVSNHCIRAGYKSDILAAGNYFDNQKLPIDEYEGDYTAIKAYNNYGADDITKKTAFTPPYTITVINPTAIVTPIKTCAGAKLTSPEGCSSCSGPVNIPPTITITSPAEKATFDGPTSVLITVSTIDKNGSVAKVDFYDGTTHIGNEDSLPFSHTWPNISFGTHTITAKATDNDGETTISSPVIIIVNNPSQPSLTATSSTQTVDSSKAIIPIVFTWGGAATDAKYTDLPVGLSASKDSLTKTLTITGTPTQNDSFSVITVGGSPVVTLTASIIIKIAGTTLADWYKFQDSIITLRFVSFTNGSVVPNYYDQSKPDNGVTYSPGALRLNKATGAMKLTLQSLEELKIRWYATGGRSLQVTWGPNGNEKVWSSPSDYESGAHELNLTSIIPELVSSSPIIVLIINNRTDGGTFNIHDLYVKGTEMLAPSTVAHNQNIRSYHSDIIKIVNNGSTLLLPIHRGKKQDLNPVFIFNLLGKAVSIQQYAELIDISKLENGLYFLRTNGYSSKFLKK